VPSRALRPVGLSLALAAAFVVAPAHAGETAAAASADRLASLALGLAIVLLAAKLAGHAAVRLGQVAVLGELLAGVLLGNMPGMAWLRDDASIDVLAQLGSLVLLFDVGLELTVRDVFDVGWSAASVAALGTACSFGFGFLTAVWLRPREPFSLYAFLGASLTATSIGITARVLKDLGNARARESHVILGAAVLDDVIALVLLAVMSGSLAAAAGGQGRLSAMTVGWIVVKAGAFLVGAFVVGVRVASWLFAGAAKLRASGAQVAAGLVLCFALAWLAQVVGLAPIVGAFTAGLILEEAHSAHFVARGERSLSELVEPVSSFLVPVFFVTMGTHVDLRVFFAPGALAVAAALTCAALLGKVGCAFGARGVARAPVAAGMLPRGEVTLIYASLGRSAHIGGRPLLDSALYGALVLVVIATTLVTPPALKWTLAMRRQSDSPASGSGPAGSTTHR
jgi:Kef-type K+ transport system membrane component KefB